MFTKIKNHCRKFESERDSISEERKSILKSIAKEIGVEIEIKGKARLIYICTHNSRRSHFGQIWAIVAAEYYGISSLIDAFSGGTEVTALHPNSVKALESLGFQITRKSSGENPAYEVKYGAKSSATCFSKVYDDSVNPKKDFFAIMTCSHADENCPFIPGAKLRFATPYEDPKEFDKTKIQDEQYLERANEIGREVFYVFSLLA